MARRPSPFTHGRSEAFERRGHAAQLRRELATLAHNVRGLRLLRGWTQSETAEAAGLHPVHVSRIELATAKPALPTLTALALSFDVRVQALFAEESDDEDPFRSSSDARTVPLFDLAAAAGAFGRGRAVEPIDRVLPGRGIATREGMFVAQVRGRSMEPLIPDGAYCLFEPMDGRALVGRVVLVQLRRYDDPETGGAYTVKRLKSAGGRRVRLVPDNKEFEEVMVERTADVRVIAALVAVLGVARASRSASTAPPNRPRRGS